MINVDIPYYQLNPQQLLHIKGNTFIYPEGYDNNTGGHTTLSLDIAKLSEIWGKGIPSEGKLNSNEHYLTFHWQIGVKTYSKIVV